MSESAIMTQNLTKRFEEITAVDELNLEIGWGELFGLLGPNGAGKTTTINMLCTLLDPTQGSARVDGYDVTSESEKVLVSLFGLTIRILGDHMERLERHKRFVLSPDDCRFQ